MFGEWRSPESNGLPTRSQHGLFAKCDVFERAWDEVGMAVAVGDVTPDGNVEPGLAEVVGATLVKLFEAIEGDHSIACDFLDPRVDRPPGLGYTLIDCEWNRLANSEELAGPCQLTRQRQLHALDLCMLSEQRRQCRKGRLELHAHASATERVERLLRAEARRELNGEEQRELGVRRQHDALPSIHSVLA